jgi:RIO kinase 2
MRRIDAKRLIDIIELEDAQEVLDLILNNIKITYTNGIINCDISEYNILVDQSNIPWIIDWPQSIDTKHPNAKDLLKRDITNIVTFFNKRYSTGRNLPYEIEKLIG